MSGKQGGDEQLRQFSDRLGRIDRIHAAGGAFEATGALGRSYFDAARRRPRRRLPLRAMALILGAFLALKGAALAQIGTEDYEKRIAALQNGNIAERVSAWALRAGPVTQGLSEALRRLTRA